MSDDARRVSGASDPSRRGFLALSGTAALAGLAGCGGVNPLAEDEPRTIAGGALREALSGEAPTVADPLPVNIEAAYVDRRLADARKSLSSVPAPFDAEEVPNGAVRRELTELRERAATALETAATAPSPTDALGSVRRARRSVREVEAAWAAVDAGLSFDDVRGSIPAAREAYEAFRTRWQYVGDDPVRAVLVHARVEELVANAGRQLNRAPGQTRHAPESPFGVAELAAAVESARAAVDDADYLFGRFESSLSNPRPVGAALTSAGESLSASVADRREALPNPESEASSYVDGEAAPVAYALVELRQGIEFADGIEGERETGRRAMVVVSALHTLVRLRAFESLRERVENEEYVTVEGVADVRAVREAAVDAVGDALASEANPRLDRSVLRVADRFESLPERIGEYHDDDEIPVRWLVRDLGEYVVVEAMARETNGATADAAEAIRSAR